MKSSYLKYCIFLSFLASTTSTAIAAERDEQEGLDEIIVTAQKREQSLQEVGVTVSVMTDEALAKLAIVDFRDWADYVPGVTISVGFGSNRAGANAVIRGVAGPGDYFLTGQATTAFTIGSVPVFNVSPSMTDLARVEVLKGPQGTIFGVSSMGGVVRYIPNTPQADQLEGYIGAGAGSQTDGSFVNNVEGMINIPIIEDVLAVRFAGSYEYNDGFIDHIYPSLDQTAPLENPQFGPAHVADLGDAENRVNNANKMTRFGSTLSVKYTPNDKAAITFLSMRHKQEMEDAWQVDWEYPEDRVITRFIDRPQDTEYVLNSLEASYEFGFGTLTYEGAKYTNDVVTVMDATSFLGSLIMGLPAMGLDFPATAAFPYRTAQDQVTHELRLQGTDLPLFGSSMTFDYTVGVFDQTEEMNGGYWIGSADWNSNLPSDAPAEAYILTENGMRSAVGFYRQYTNEAVFADISLHVTDKLTVSVGARDHKLERGRDGWTTIYGDWYHPVDGWQADDPSNHEFWPEGREPRERAIPQTPTEFSGTTPRLAATYAFTDDVMSYFTVSTGQRIGGSAGDPRTEDEIIADWQPAKCGQLAKDLGLVKLIQQGQKSDEVTSYDIGVKTMSLNNRLLLNGSVYSSDWTDLHSAVILFSFDPDCSQQARGNIGSAQIRGFELESRFQVTDNLSINGHIAYADAVVDYAPDGVMDTIGEPLEKGDALADVPEWTAHFGVEYRFLVPFGAADTDGFVRLDWRYVDERIKATGDKPTMRDVMAYNVSPAYDLTDIRVGVNNESWDAQVYVSNVFNERVSTSTTTNYFQPLMMESGINTPRTIGFRFRKHF